MAAAVGLALVGPTFAQPGGFGGGGAGGPQANAKRLETEIERLRSQIRELDAKIGELKKASQPERIQATPKRADGKKGPDGPPWARGEGKGRPGGPPWMRGEGKGPGAGGPPFGPGANFSGPPFARAGAGNPSQHQNRGGSGDIEARLDRIMQELQGIRNELRRR